MTSVKQDAKAHPKILVPITADLVAAIDAKRTPNGNGKNEPWENIAAGIDGWTWHFVTLSDIHKRRQATVDIEIYHVLGIKPPPIKINLGNVSLVEITNPALVELIRNADEGALVTALSDWLECRQCAGPDCDAMFYARSWNHRYCRRHDSRSAWYRSKAGEQWRENREEK